MRSVAILRTLVILVLCSCPAAAEDFWQHWGDGRAELNGYHLELKRYGAPRTGKAVLIYVTEEFSDSLRVKADPGQHPASDVFPVLKLNAVHSFQTGIYDYKLMTSVFSRFAENWQPAKVSFSSQEWCGHVYQQLLARVGRVTNTWHSYFDGEADGSNELPLPNEGLFADALPIVLRGLRGAWLKPGEKRSLPLLPSLASARLEHKPLSWGRATIERAARPRAARVPAGAFQVDVYSVAVDGGALWTYEIESAWPHRLVSWSNDVGERGELLKSTRLPYWKLNAPGGERYLAEVGLR